MQLRVCSQNLGSGTRILSVKGDLTTTILNKTRRLVPSFGTTFSRRRVLLSKTLIALEQPRMPEQQLLFLRRWNRAPANDLADDNWVCDSRTCPGCDTDTSIRGESFVCGTGFLEAAYSTGNIPDNR